MAGYKDGSSTAQVTQMQTTFLMASFSLVMAFSGWMMGFDTGYSGTVLQMETFNKAFGKCAVTPHGMVCQLGATRQSVSSISNLFIGVGSGLAGITANYFGRRWGLHIGCVLVVIGAAGQMGTSSNYLNYMVCKCIAGLGIGQFQVIGIAYGVESVSPRKRGVLISFFAVGLSLGSFKTPIACEIPISLMYILVVMIFPESPRWLLIKGKEEQARVSFGKFYKLDPYSNGVTAQIEHTKAGLEFEKLTSSTVSWTETFHRSYVRRTTISAFVLVGSAICGTYFVVPYAALFRAGVGIKNPFLTNVYLGVCGTAGSFVGPFVVEYAGRRLSILVGYGLMACCMIIFSAVSTGLGSITKIAENVLVAFLFLWYFFYGCFIVPAGWLASSEVHSVALRAPGQAFVAVLAQIMTFAASFWTPYMLSKDYGNMGTNFGYFYFGITVVVWVVMFGLVPETARISLEQFDDIFASRIPAWKTFLRRNKAIANRQEVYFSTDGRLAVTGNSGGSL